MLLAKLLRLVAMCVLALAALGAHARQIENVSLEKISAIGLICPRVEAAQSVDASGEIEGNYDGCVSGNVQYLFNECVHTRDCGRGGGYDSSDKARGLWSDLRGDSMAGADGCVGSGPALCFGPGAIRGVGNTAAKFFEGTTLADRVVGQMKLGDNHAFPASVDGFAARYGTASTVMDSRGNPVQMLTVDGAYNGAKGTFEYIKNQAGQIYHRFFNAPK